MTVGNITPSIALTDADGNASTRFTALTAGSTAVNAANGTISGSANVNVTTVMPPTNITVAIRTIEIGSNISRALSLHEIIPAGWDLIRISDDADGFKSSTSEWIWFNVSPGINRTVIYRLTAPDNASIGTYHFNGTISNSSGVIAVVQGDNTIAFDIIALDLNAQ